MLKLFDRDNAEERDKKADLLKHPGAYKILDEKIWVWGDNF